MKLLADVVLGAILGATQSQSARTVLTRYLRAFNCCLKAGPSAPQKAASLCATGFFFSDLLLKSHCWNLNKYKMFQHYFMASVGTCLWNNFTYLHYEVILVHAEIHLSMFRIAWMHTWERYKKFLLLKHQPWRLNIFFPYSKRNLILAFWDSHW